MADSVGMAVNLVRNARLFPGIPYAYAALAARGALVEIEAIAVAPPD